MPIILSAITSRMDFLESSANLNRLLIDGPICRVVDVLEDGAQTQGGTRQQPLNPGVPLCQPLLLHHDPEAVLKR